MFWKLFFHLAASFVIVTSQNKVGVLDGAVDGGSNLVGGIFNFLGNIPRILQIPSVANDRVEENFDVTDDISINERNIADNSKKISKIDNGDNELSDLMNITKNKETKDEASPNIIQFGKVVVDGAVGEGSKIVGGVFNFFGNIPKIFPRPTVSFKRVENKDDLEVRNGSVEEGDDVAMLENSEIDLDRVEENSDVTDDISINERKIADNTKIISNIDNGENELSDVMNITKNKESEDDDSPNIIQFGKVVVDGAVGEGSKIVGEVFNFLGNIPKIFPRPAFSFERVENKDDIEVRNGSVEEGDDVAMLENSEIDLDRVEENFDVTDDILKNERNIADNTKIISNIDNGDNERSDVMNITKNKESESEDSPNIIQFGKVLVDGAVGEGSKIVGGVFKLLGNIPKIFPRPTVSFERVANSDDIEVRNGRVEEDDDEELFQNSEIELVLENNYCGVKVPASTLVEVIANISHFSTFRELVEFADVESELSRDGGVTVLTPDNQAFDKIDMSRVDMLFSDQDLAKQTVLSHILNEVLCCAAISRNNGIFFNNTRRRSLTGSI